MSSTAPATRSDWVEDRLRTAILRGELEPGQRVHASELAERWSVSATPLREALQRLAGHGLVEMLPQRGARVSQISADEALDIYDLRLQLEPITLRRSLEMTDEDHRNEIRAAFHAFRTAASLDATVDAHSQLHASLLSRCPSAWRLRLTGQLADASRLFQVTSVASGSKRRHPVKEHKAIVDAALSGDIDHCVALHEQHLRRTLELIGATAAAAGAANSAEKPPTSM